MVSKRERVDVVENTPLFKRLTKGECQRLAPVFKVRMLDDGEVLCHQGDTGDYMVVVAHGELVVEVEGRDGETTVVDRRERSQAVGEMACLDPSPRSATVRADGPAEVLVLSRTMLDSLKTNASSLFSRVVRGIAYRLAEMLDDTNALISELLDTSTAPKQANQPDSGTLLTSMSPGEQIDAIREGVALESKGALAGLADEELEVLRSATEARRYEPGSVICLEGEPAPEAYFIAEGQIEVLRAIGRKNYRMATIGKGGFLGQRALLMEGRRSATLRAGIDGATIFGLSRQRFDALLEAESDLAFGFQETVTIAGIRQLRLANEMAAYLGARERRHDLPGPKKRQIDRTPDPDESVDERVRELVEEPVDEDEEIESLASAYLQTALEDWDVTPSELSNIQIVEADGEMSAEEKKIREKLEES